MSTIQLTPTVATVPTSKAVQSISEAFSGLFRQSLFIHCEQYVINDDEMVITLRDSFISVTLNVQSAELPIAGEGGAA